MVSERQAREEAQLDIQRNSQVDLVPEFFRPAGVPCDESKQHLRSCMWNASLSAQQDCRIHPRAGADQTLRTMTLALLSLDPLLSGRGGRARNTL